jgi:aspartate kinase
VLFLREYGEFYPGVAAQMFTTLHNASINIQMIATSEIKVICVVAEAVGVQALQLIHAAFELAGTPAVVVLA